MTKIRSTDSANIDDRRGDSSGGFGGINFPSVGGGSSSGGSSGLPFPVKAGGGLMTILLLLAALVLPKIFGSTRQSSSIADNNASQVAQAQGTATSTGSCSTDLEQIVCGVTNDVQAYWTTALPKYFGVKYEMTKTVMFTDATSSGCGEASAQTGPFYCPVDHEVYLDLAFMQQLEQMLVGQTSDLAEQYIVAHDKVQTASQNNPSMANQYSVGLELQADCYAGVWVGDANARGLLDSPTEINEALKAAEGVGDDAIQSRSGSVNPDTFTHGTSEQRMQWFQRGYQTQDPRTCNTFRELGL